MKRNFLYIFFSLCLLLLGGCSADEPLMLPGADGETTLNLLIPAPEMAHTRTRAENSPHGDRLAEEGKIKTLSVVGFYEKDEVTHHFFYELTDEQATEVQNVYRSYKLSVVPADYRLYVLANIPVGALKTDLEKKTTVAGLENKVKALTHSFSSLPLASDGLPMAATQEAKVADKQDKQVVVDLRFVCAKARMTVIYNNAYGSSNPFKIDALNVHNTYTPSKVFLSSTDNHGTGATKNSVIENAGLPKHYELSDDLAEKELDDWLTIPDEDSDPLNGFTEELSGNSGWDKFAYQNTVYIPECVGKAEGTYIELTAGELKSTINVGCELNGNSSKGKVERGHFYDIVAMVEGGEITYQWKVSDWTPEELAVQLAGLSRLYLEQTLITTMKGEDALEIYYESDAPRLKFEPVKVKYGTMTAELPLFDVDEDKANHKLIVTVNPKLPVNNDLLKSTSEQKLGFWVISGNIKKFVEIQEVDLKPYLRLLPAVNSVSIRNIANESRYRLYFDYATNADNLTLSLTSFTNSNDSKGYIPSDEQDPDKITAGYFFEICTPDSVAITKPIKVESLSGEKNLLDPSYLTSEYIAENGGEATYPSDGFIRLTIKEPILSAYYAKEIKGKFKASANSVTAKEAQFIVEPNPTKYIVHFKAIKDGKYSWTMPHIYIYQALYYDGYPVYGHKQKNDPCDHSETNIQWLEYSFSGNIAFKGWKKDGNEDGVANLTQSLTTFKDQGGATIRGYNLCHTWGDPGTSGSFTTGENDRYRELTLIDNKKSGCSNCRDYGPYTLWPGVGMQQEEDGWWKIELPLLVKPGLAQIMFADGHADNPGTRYPAHGIPGIVLPNYTDKEAWYLLDENIGGENCSFSDDRRDSYPGSKPMVENPEQGDNDDRKVLLYWHKNDYSGNGTGLLFYEIDSSGNWSNFWPNTNWSQRPGTYNDPYYYLVLESNTDLEAFDKMKSASKGGYQFKKDGDGTGYGCLWNDNKRKTVDESEIPQQVKVDGITEWYQLWK